MTILLKNLIPSSVESRSALAGAALGGFKSLEIVRQSPGISYEQFLKAGVGSDLKWDVAWKRVHTKA